MHLPENHKLKHLVQHIKHTSILMLSWKLETLIIIITILLLLLLLLLIIIIIIIIIVVVVIIMMLEIRVYIKVRYFH